MNRFPLRLKSSLVLFAVVMGLDPVGFSLIENRSHPDSGCVSIESVTTVGYTAARGHKHRADPFRRSS
ncbi:MAG: hypothetical protein RQ754_00615 [Desulfuromonadales bacterium]|nr:hypothetical protein [Desulfuromonadales bacterium]